MGLRLPAAAASMSERRGFRCWRCSRAARSPGSRIAGSSSSRGGSRRMSDVEDRAGVVPERVREAPSRGAAPPGDHVRGSRPPRRRARPPRSPTPPRPRQRLRRPRGWRSHPVRRGKQEASERVLWQPPLREAAPPGIASRMFLVLPKEPHSPGNGIAVSASPMPTPPMISTHRQKPAASACSGLSATATPSTLSYERYGRSRSTGGRLGDHDQRSVTGRGHALPSSTSCSTMRGRGSEVRDGTW